MQSSVLYLCTQIEIKCKKMKKVTKQVIDFATFLTKYRGAWKSKSNSGARVA